MYDHTLLALTGASAAINSSGTVFLLGSVTFLQWALQLGLLTTIPLFVLLVVEGGVWHACTTVGGMLLRGSPFFFIYETVTKAAAFDNALAFGRTSYVATGRDYVFTHISFDAQWRATAMPHFYLGAEVS